jgi:orotidine 5'-phosphate decarboxylase subfamily 2
MSFFAKLSERVTSVGSPLCIGIDPTPDLLEPPNLPVSALAFSKRLVDETSHLAAVYKPNAAFFEALGPDGWNVLHDIVKYIKTTTQALVILDAKRGDIGSTAEAYAQACFDKMDVDCVTVSPYMGRDSVQPFLKLPDTGIFVLCKTSNPGSSDFQTLTLNDGRYVYEAIVDSFKNPTRVGFVVGATDLDAIQAVRNRAPDAWILAPGLGFQGGNIHKGDSKILYSVSRGIYVGGKYRDNAQKFKNILSLT